MEVNSSSDDEVQNPQESPNAGGKKLKLNDGSSQESLKSLKEEESSSSKGEKDENVDSGISADKSESTSSEEPAPAPSEGPSNELIHAAPSSSNVRTILVNIRRPMRSRNYRKRKTPGRDSDSNDASSQDSDDLTSSENGSEPRPEANSHSDNSDDLDNYISRFSDSSHSGSSSSDSGDDSSHSSPIREASAETDSDSEGIWSRLNGSADDEADKGDPPSVLLKTRPKHNYLILREIINREMGYNFFPGQPTKGHTAFEQRFYGSLHAVYRLKKLHLLNKHKGCVNAINFHPEGHLLASGSDDTNVIIWDWARSMPLQVMRTGHKSNVFQSKFLHLNAQSQLNIVTCARDGQVRLLQCAPSGGQVSRRKLCAHARTAHKLHVSAAQPHLVLSAGEDGVLMQSDVRADTPSKLFQVKDGKRIIPLYSVVGHPLDTNQLLLAGRDKFLRVYDRRKTSSPAFMYCPSFFNNNPENMNKKVKLSMMHLTCAIYNHNGTEILGSYNDENIYLFDAKDDVYDAENTNTRDGYTHRYSGHRNSATYKGVSFFGPKSEYVVSGSDCSYIYVWEKKTESIVQWMRGDVNGVVNCVEAHPTFPIMATSGLDKDIKIWSPTSQKDPDYEGLEQVVRENSVTRHSSPLFNDFLPSLYSAWRSDNRSFVDEDSFAYGGNIEFDGNVCTAM